MPIINKNAQVIFGTGDIAAEIGCLSDRSFGVVQFIEIEPRRIGERFTTDKKKMEIGGAPVTLVFNKIESLDAVIYQLQKLRDIMSGEGKYEWSKSGRIVEKNDN